MSFAEGWDRRDRRTLRFLDPELETAFQTNTAEAARRLLLWACLVNIPIWVVGGVLAPLVLDVDPRAVLVACAIELTVLCGGVLFALRPHPRRAISVFGLAINLTAGIVIVVITTWVGLFDRFAAPFVIFAAVVAMAVQRLPFTLAVVGVAVHVLVFSIMALAVGTAALFQIFLVGSALGTTLSGIYL